ncbi:MAG: siroheme synthase CysG [Variibacter sp.]
MTMHVQPRETRPVRLASLSKLPLFLELAGKKCVIVGDGDAVAWKAELFASAGARVRVFAPAPCAELTYVAEGNAAVDLVARPCRDADLDDTSLLIIGVDDAEDARRLAAAARSRGILVNVIDQPALCDFQFGTIVNRSPVVIGISTDGAAPILGQAIRRRIEAVLPASVGAWAAAAKEFRVRLKDILTSRAARRQFWERFVDITFISQQEEDEKLAALERMAQTILAGKAPPPVGHVAIVGAGPGAPDLLTLKAMRELQAADVILYDRLVTPEVLELGRREARRILVGKSGHGERVRQSDINALIISLARDGQRVVRLKGGDPAIFGRTSEETEACRAAGIPFSIVPGVTTASAAAAALALSLTQREDVRRVQFITGHDRHGELPADLDLGTLADPHATTIVYMGRRTAALLAQRLRAHGLPAATPVIVATNVSRRDQRVLPMRLGGLAEGELPPDGDAPTLIMIGRAFAQPAQDEQTFSAAAPAPVQQQALAAAG